MCAPCGQVSSRALQKPVTICTPSLGALPSFVVEALEQTHSTFNTYVRNYSVIISNTLFRVSHSPVHGCLIQRHSRWARQRVSSSRAAEKGVLRSVCASSIPPAWAAQPTTLCRKLLPVLHQKGDHRQNTYDACACVRCLAFKLCTLRLRMYVAWLIQPVQHAAC